MCHPTSCKTCGNITWAGCGAHVAAVRARVPADQWCAGHGERRSDSRRLRILSRRRGGQA